MEAYADRRWNANKVPTPTGNFTVPHSVKSVTLNDTTLAHEGAKTQVDFYMLSQMLGFYDLIVAGLWGPTCCDFTPLKGQPSWSLTMQTYHIISQGFWDISTH